MTEILFYHLERQPLERVLPLLVEKTVQRGWRAVIECPGGDRLAALDDALWTFADDSFLPHAREAEPGPGQEVVVLTGGTGNANAAQVRFLVDGAGMPDDAAHYERIVLIFDGADEAALAQARAEWKSAKDGGHDCTYWQQTAEGRWERKA